jgi:hypothetical protein
MREILKVLATTPPAPKKEEPKQELNIAAEVQKAIA